MLNPAPIKPPKKGTVLARIEGNFGGKIRVRIVKAQVIAGMQLVAFPATVSSFFFIFNTFKAWPVSGFIA